MAIHRTVYPFKAWRKAAKLTRKQVSEAIGVTVGTVRRWEIGETYPNALNLEDMARMYGCSVSDMLGI